MKSYLLKLIDGRDQELEKLKFLYEGKHESCCSNCIYGKTQLKDVKRLCKYKGTVDEDYLCRRYKKLPVSNQSILNYKKLIYKAAEVLSEFYQKELSTEKFLKDEDPVLRSIAMKALASSNELPNLIKLDRFPQMV